jgi:hypothetical protein
MTPESRNSEIRGENLKTSIARQLLSKHIPAATNMQTTIEELPLLCNGALNIPSEKQRLCFLRGLCRGVIRMTKKIVEFRDASLPGYELGSGGI